MKQWGKYLFVFVLTSGIFAASWYLSTYFNQKKLNEIREIQDRVATSISASETDFSLLQELSCQDLGQAITTEELNELASKISYSEQNVASQSDIETLKTQYSILEVKDFLLKKRISERCRTPFYTILYFYGTEKNCTDCIRQGYVLDSLRTTYPEINIYSFDYDLQLSTIRALKRIYKIGDTLPALVINGKAISGFKTAEEIEKLLPPTLTKAKAETKKSTSTQAQ